MSRTVRLLLLLAALLVLLVFILRSAADPAPTRPEVMPGGTATRKVFDLLSAPSSLVVEHARRESALPGAPERYLLAELVPEGLRLVWLDWPDAKPGEALLLPVRGQMLEAYIDKHNEGLAVVEVWAGYTPDAGRLRVALRLAQ